MLLLPGSYTELPILKAVSRAREVVATVTVVMCWNRAGGTAVVAVVVRGVFESLSAVAVLVIAVAEALCLWLLRYRGGVILVYLREIDLFFCVVTVALGMQGDALKSDEGTRRGVSS